MGRFLMKMTKKVLSLIVGVAAAVALLFLILEYADIILDKLYELKEKALTFFGKCKYRICEECGCGYDDDDESDDDCCCGCYKDYIDEDASETTDDSIPENTIPEDPHIM
jgi:hypothetical protein